MANQSYGFIEIVGVVAAVDALDIMCKTSGVELATWERKLGGRLATIVIKGDVASVTEAVEAAKNQAIKKPVASGVIASPHDEVVRLVELSASRFIKKEEDHAEEVQKTPAVKTTPVTKKTSARSRKTTTTDEVK